MSLLPIRRLSESRPALEGAGVYLRRAFGFDNTTDFEPFLLLVDTMLRSTAGVATP